MAINLKTEILTTEKSDYLCSLNLTKAGMPFIEIQQRSRNHTARNEAFKIRIRPEHIQAFIITIQKLTANPDNKAPLRSNRVEIIKELINHYLKGLKIEDLALQFGLTKAQVEEILSINEIPIVDNNLSKPKVQTVWKYRKKKHR